MIYQLFELQRAAFAPLNLAAEAAQAWSDRLIPGFGGNGAGRAVQAALELLARSTRHHRNVAFDVTEVAVDGASVAVEERAVDRLPFCTLRHFARAATRHDPRVLVIAPLSGHFSALLNDVVQVLLEAHDVYVTDWADARDVPLAQGPFDLDTYIDYLIRYIRRLGPDLHVIAFSQSTVPLLAASALLASAGDRHEPRTITLVGGPLDTRINTTPAQAFAASQSGAWYEGSLLTSVPFGYRGAGRRVLPGFIQLATYISHDLDRHVGAHLEFFGKRVLGDEAGADAHRRFYDRFFSVLDLTAEFFLDTLAAVFQRHDLARGTMTWRGLPVDLAALEHPALLTVEGERDEVAAPGQTAAAQAICPGIAADRRAHHLEPGAGHLGLVHGRHWRGAIAPRISSFIRAHR